MITTAESIETRTRQARPEDIFPGAALRVRLRTGRRRGCRSQWRGVCLAYPCVVLGRSGGKVKVKVGDVLKTVDPRDLETTL